MSEAPVGSADGPTFEETLARLEEIVGLLERGEAPLEEGLALFEEGVALTRRCQDLLAAAEERIRRLVAEGDRFTLAPFSVEGAEDGT
jgi:exodeoxyribonuclease VII small subunit